MRASGWERFVLMNVKLVTYIIIIKFYASPCLGFGLQYRKQQEQEAADAEARELTNFHVRVSKQRWGNHSSDHCYCLIATSSIYALCSSKFDEKL